MGRRWALGPLAHTSGVSPTQIDIGVARGRCGTGMWRWTNATTVLTRIDESGDETNDDDATPRGDRLALLVEQPSDGFALGDDVMRGDAVVHPLLGHRCEASLRCSKVRITQE